jgi:uncharacterized FlaG/YvyC family protein
MHGRHDLAVGGNIMPAGRAGTNQVESISAGEVDQAVQNASAYAKTIGRDLNFTIDKELNRTVITVHDGESGKIIRQVPMEEMIAIAKMLSDVQAPGEETVLKGLLLDQDS